MSRLKNIHNILKSIADDHIQINSFFWGDTLRAVNESTLLYPALIAFPENATISNNILKVNIVLFIVDRVNKDMSNLLDVESDMLEIANDIRLLLRDRTYVEYVVDVSDVLIPVRDNFKDEVWGWKIGLTFNMPNSLQSCNVPISNI